MVLIGCPIRNRGHMLEDYLSHIYRQDYKGSARLYFIANNCTDNTIDILKKHKSMGLLDYSVLNNRNVLPDTRNKVQRRTNLYHWLVKLRNLMLDKAKELQCDFLLSCDSDILMRPDTLSRLIGHNLPVVSALVYNGYLASPENPWCFPNIMSYDGIKYRHIANYWVKYPEKSPVGKLLRVDLTGACVLIRKDMYKYPYSYVLQGEDAGFCEAVKKGGYEIFCDVSLFNTHKME